MTVNGHIMLSLPIWSHLRGLVALVCRNVQQRYDIGVSILTGGNIIKRLKLRSLVRYASILDRAIGVLEENPNIIEFFPSIGGSCLAFYEAIYRQETVKCVVSGKTFQSWPKPKLAIADIRLVLLGLFTVITSCVPFMIQFFVESLKEIRSIDPTITTLAWTAINNSASFRVWGPEELGGPGDISTKAIIEAEKTGNP
ncbi:glycosyltransferase family 1 protein [Sphaerobolus stellatus SS14]|uniref:Glycosyltransferase family 1 protein n=1 Tax=Sphaerobolus stellatus (strain SS14) TaxID=990650 RepID=A0A0C9W3F4_SPHS4|nr:glycosyltransferase family 1 protein [Sphaerobolus stellatus SS14]